MKIITLLVVMVFTAQSMALEVEGVQAFEKYLNNTKTLQADFVQTTPSQGLQLDGTLYLTRDTANNKSQLVWEYADGSRLRKLADGRVFWQNQHGTVTQLPNRHPLLTLFQADEIDLDDGDLPYSVNQLGKTTNTLELALVPKSDTDGADVKTPIQLVFNAKKPALEKMITQDELGQMTVVRLQNSQRNQLISKNIFEFVPPEEQGLLN